MRESRGSGGLFIIEARWVGEDRHTRWFNITKGRHITTAREELKDTGTLTKLAEKIYVERYG